MILSEIAMNGPDNFLGIVLGKLSVGALNRHMPHVTSTALHGRVAVALLIKPFDHVSMRGRERPWLDHGCKAILLHLRPKSILTAMELGKDELVFAEVPSNHRKPPIIA